MPQPNPKIVTIRSGGPFELFAADLLTNAPGSYSGNIEIQGGVDGGTFTAFNDLVDEKFSVTVGSSKVKEPEIDADSALTALALLLGSLTVLRGRRVA